MSESAIQLDYANPPLRRRRRWFVRGVIAIAFIALAASAWQWGPEKWERAQLLYWQWRCMRYSPPADQIVFDQDPAGRPALLNSPQAYVPLIKPGYEGPAITTAAAKVPDCAYRFLSMARGFASLPLGNLAPPIIFMHERYSPSGKRYLVILYSMNGEDGNLMDCPVGQIGVNVELWEPAALDVPPRLASDPTGFFGICLLDANIVQRLRVFAGQADPNDPTHFTIRFEQDGRAGIVDGYVCDKKRVSGRYTFPDWIPPLKLIERRAN